MPILGKDGKYRPLGTNKVMDKNEYDRYMKQGSSVTRAKPINAKYEKKGSDYRPGTTVSGSGESLADFMRKKNESNTRVVPAIEESLIKEDDLG